LLGHEDGAHAALADLLQQLIRADAVARPFGEVRGRPRTNFGAERSGQAGVERIAGDGVILGPFGVRLVGHASVLR